MTRYNEFHCVCVCLIVPLCNCLWTIEIVNGPSGLLFKSGAMFAFHPFDGCCVLACETTPCLQRAAYGICAAWCLCNSSRVGCNDVCAVRGCAGSASSSSSNCTPTVSINSSIVLTTFCKSSFSTPPVPLRPRLRHRNHQCPPLRNGAKHCMVIIPARNVGLAL